MRIYNKANGVIIHRKIKRQLAKLANGNVVEYVIRQRANMILDAIKGIVNNKIGLSYGVSRNVVSRWLNRFLSSLQTLNRIAKKRPEELYSKLRAVLSDSPRSGRPPVFDAVIRTQIIGIACNSPSDYGLIRSHWSLPVLRQAIISQGIVQAISCATINRILQDAELKPHKNCYWLHSKEKDENPFTYRQKIREINSIYFTASMINQFGGDADLRIISTDEMTGIQALERKYPDKPAKPHMVAKTEFEYIRHGTISLTGFLDVVTGKMVHPYLNKTRTADDFTVALAKLINSDPDKHWIIVADNLNTHYSEKVARFVAEKCGITDAEEKGCFKTTKSRIEFLTDSSHRIRFAFTPKHCSWMNQIEIWFGIINKQLLRRKSFLSVQELEQDIRSFINQYNSMFAHPFNWRYNSTPIGTGLLGNTA